MVFRIVQWVIISLILILLVHHLFLFFKNTLTVPKVKDLIHQPSNMYKEIEETLQSSNNTIKLSSIDNNCNNGNNGNKNIDTKEMKNELKDFFNEISQNKSTILSEPSSSFGSFPQMNELSKNMYSEL